MPVIEPATSEVNFTPSVTEAVSESATVPGTVDAVQTLHGQPPPPEPDPTVTGTPGPAVSRLPLSSTARLRIVVEKFPDGVQVYVQLARPLAGCHVLPLSTDTSTPPTTPPVSDAVPAIVIVVPDWSEAPEVGAVIVEVAATVSVDAEAATRFGCSVLGCTFMSASRLTVACCMRASAAALPRSWLESRPHDHCTVPAPKTRAPLGCL